MSQSAHRRGSTMAGKQGIWHRPALSASYGTPLIRTNCVNSHPHKWCRHNRACACSSCQRNVRQTSKECRLERIIPFHRHPNNSSHWACNHAERHKSDYRPNAAQRAASRLTAADPLSFALQAWGSLLTHNSCHADNCRPAPLRAPAQSLTAIAARHTRWPPMPAKQ